MHQTLWTVDTLQTFLLSMLIYAAWETQQDVTGYLKTSLGLGREDCQHTVIDEFLCMVADCALGTDVYHWMFKQKSTWFKVNKIPL